MIVYLHSKCSTCQKALSFLESKKSSFIPFPENGITVKDIVKEPPTLGQLQKMLAFQNGEIKKLLNTSGMLYKEMQLSKKISSMQTLEVLDLLSQHGMLVKRPFLLASDFGLVGFNEALWAQKIP